MNPCTVSKGLDKASSDYQGTSAPHVDPTFGSPEQETCPPDLPHQDSLPVRMPIFVFQNVDRGTSNYQDPPGSANYKRRKACSAMPSDGSNNDVTPCARHPGMNIIMTSSLRRLVNTWEYESLLERWPKADDDTEVHRIKKNQLHHLSKNFGMKTTALTDAEAANYGLDASYDCKATRIQHTESRAGSSPDMRVQDFVWKPERYSPRPTPSRKPEVAPEEKGTQMEMEDDGDTGDNNDLEQKLSFQVDEDSEPFHDPHIGQIITAERVNPWKRRLDLSR